MTEAAHAPSIWRRREVQKQSGLSRSTLYARIDAGLWPKPVSLGVRAVGWPDDEVQAVLRARIAGCSDDEERGLFRSRPEGVDEDGVVSMSLRGKASKSEARAS